MADEGMMSMSLNGTTVNVTVTSEEQVVKRWVDEIEGVRRYRHIGIATQGGLAADSLQLYTNERCLVYKFLPPLSSCHKVLEFLKQEDHVFIGQPHVGEKLAAAVVASGSGHALHITNWIDGPAASDYMVEARLPPHLQDNELNRYEILKMSCLDAMAGWLFARGRPPAN